VTAQHGLIYADLIQSLGREKAALYFEANQKAVDAIRALAKTIPCDFEEKIAYVYSVGEAEKLAREAGAYAALGIASVFQESPPLPIQTDGALGMKNQGQMNPLKLLYALAEPLEIYEDTFVTEISGSIAYRSREDPAEHIILATTTLW
jgi:glycine/D-amino acid oxidase-like deaminating enzyme